MTAALAPSPAATLPTAAAVPVTARVRRLDPQELMAVAQTLAAEQQAVAAAQEAQAAQAREAAQAEQQRAAAAARPQVATAASPATTSSPAATAAPATSAAAAAAGTSSAVPIPSSPVAPRTQHDYWTRHIAQFAGKYLPDGPSMRPNCGPASATMALRMIGLDIPGFRGQNSSAVLDQARILATGKNDVSVGTTDSELETLITKSGARWSESTDFGQVTDWVKQGIPVILSGNPAHGWNNRYSAQQVYPFDGGHWVTVSGYDKATGHYIVNDPLSQIGPIYVSESELRSYNRAHGNLGIAVFR